MTGYSEAEGEHSPGQIQEWRELSGPQLAHITFITGDIGIIDAVQKFLIKKCDDDPSDVEAIEALNQVEQRRKSLTGQNVLAAKQAAEASVNPPRPGSEFNIDNHETLLLSERAEIERIFKEIELQNFHDE